MPGAHVGAKLFSFLRADLGYNYRGNLDFKTHSLGTLLYATDVDNASTLMFSVYFEPIRYKQWTPYIGAGVGSAWTKIKTNDGVVEAKDTDTNFAWQAEAGLQRELTEHLTLKLGYRYVDMGTSKIPLEGIGNHVAAGDYKADLTAHEVIVGLRYSF